jgi:hypothetical protein
MQYVKIISYMLLLKNRNHLKREGGGIDAASKDTISFAKWMEFVQGTVQQKS